MKAHYRFFIITAILIGLPTFLNALQAIDAAETPKSRTSAVKVEFIGGSSISGDVVSWDGEKGIIKCDLGEIPLDKAKITAESLLRIEDAANRAKPVELILKNGIQVKGRLISWNGGTVIIEADMGDVTIPVEKLSEESMAKVNELPKAKVTSSPLPVSSTTNGPVTNNAADYKALTKYIVIVEGDSGKGTGFLAQYQGKIYLFTNLHVLDGNKSIKGRTMDGRELVLGKLLASTEYDLAAIELPQEKDGLQLQERLDTSVTLGEEVVVFGNSFGGGVATDLTGKVVAVGPQVVETDVKFVSGNSGSAIISKKSHRVLGIASHCSIRKANDFGKDSKFNNVERRFAYRLDNNPGWQEMTLAQFINETLFIKKLEARTSGLWDVADDFNKNGKITKYSQKNEWDNKTDEIINTFLRKRDEIEGGNHSAADWKELYKKLWRDLDNACSSDLNINYQFCDWHQRIGRSESAIDLWKDLRQKVRVFFQRRIQEIQ